MRGHIVDVDQYAIDAVRPLRPLPRGLAFLARVLGPVVVRRRGGEHYHPAARLHLTVAQTATLAEHARPLAKAESSRQPVHGRRPVFIREHRDHGRIPIAHAASPGRYSPKTPRSTAQHSPIVT